MFVLVVVIFFGFLLIGGFNKILGNSMVPNYLNGQECITLKIVYWFSKPKRGDVVTYASSKDSSMDNIGRIIALPGELVSIESGQVYINHQLFSESYLSPNTQSLPASFNNIVVDNDSYFIMGDNRIHSSDSRHNGVVKVNKIHSKVVFKI